MQRCTDPKDRVFGLLVLIGFTGQSPLMADYSLSAEEICEDISKCIVKLSYMRGNWYSILRLHDIWRARLNLGSKDAEFVRFIQEEELRWKESPREVSHIRSLSA